MRHGVSHATFWRAAAGVDGAPARGQSATSTRSVLTHGDGSTTSEQPEGAHSGVAHAVVNVWSACCTVLRPLWHMIIWAAVDVPMVAARMPRWHASLLINWAS